MKLETGGGGCDSQGLLNTPPHWGVRSSDDTDLKRWMLEIILLIFILYFLC